MGASTQRSLSIYATDALSAASLLTCCGWATRFRGVGRPLQDQRTWKSHAYGRICKHLHPVVTWLPADWQGGEGWHHNRSWIIGEHLHQWFELASPRLHWVDRMWQRG